MSLLLPQRAPSLTPRWVCNDLWRRARSVPSLDLRFADSKSLVDATTGANLVTFTRASSGTYVDSQGVIRTATTNLLLRSEEFDNASWVAQGGYSVTSNQAVSPNGTLTAELVSRSNTGTQYLYQNVTASGTLTFSCWARTVSGTATFRLGAYNATDGFKESSDFTATTTWRRYSFTVTQSAASSSWYPCNGAANSSFYIWGAQLEQSSSVGEYIPTGATINSAPRFDHNPTTGESLGLLVEEQRQNLATNSATFQPSSASNPASYTVDQVAPDGTTTGSRQTASSPRTLVDYTGIANAAYTFSFYCRVTSGTAGFGIQLKNAASDTVIASDTSPVATTSWRRFSITGTTNGATAGARIELTGIVPGFVFWGAQLEAGAFPTSYIPTTTSAATRSADVASIATLGANVRSLFSQFRSPASGTRPIVSLDDNSSNNRIELFTSATDPKLLITSGGVAQADIDAGSVTANTTTRLAARFSTDNFAASVSGAASITDTSGTLPAADRVRIGRDQAGNYLNGTIARATAWDAALPMLAPISG